MGIGISGSKTPYLYRKKSTKSTRSTPKESGRCAQRRDGSRGGVRRFTRLTNAFSKKFENHCHMVAIYHAYYNFCRVHQTLRVTPAMEAGLTDHVWSVAELVQMQQIATAQVAA
jgi:hypothetical protein